MDNLYCSTKPKSTGIIISTFDHLSNLTEKLRFKFKYNFCKLLSHKKPTTVKPFTNPKIVSLRTETKDGSTTYSIIRISDPPTTFTSPVSTWKPITSSRATPRLTHKTSRTTPRTPRTTPKTPRTTLRTSRTTPRAPRTTPITSKTTPRTTPRTSRTTPRTPRTRLYIDSQTGQTWWDV